MTASSKIIINKIIKINIIIIKIIQPGTIRYIYTGEIDGYVWDKVHHVMTIQWSNEYNLVIWVGWSGSRPVSILYRQNSTGQPKRVVKPRPTSYN